jgi:hypothetical protein
MGSWSAYDVLEHISNDSDFLSEISNRLEVNGTLTITVPAYNFLWSTEDEYAGHFRRYKLKELTAKLISNRFEIVFSS